VIHGPRQWFRQGTIGNSINSAKTAKLRASYACCAIKPNFCRDDAQPRLRGSRSESGRGYTETMPTASWNQLERTVEQLHAAARESVGVREFYRQLVADAAAALDAARGAAWMAGAGGRPELICQSLPDEGIEDDWPKRRELIGAVLDGGAATVAEFDARHDLLLCPVEQPAREGCNPGRAGAIPPAAVLELWLPRGASPPVRQGWLDFAAALADIAADFHAREELRRLRGTSALQIQAVDLMRRLAAAQSLAGAAFEVANEGRRLLGCDRVAIVLRHDDAWRLTAVSGVDAAQHRTEFGRHSERLADQIAAWGEPIEHTSAPGIGDDERPPRLADALEGHIDHSHARALVGVPIKFAAADPAPTARFDFVLLAERFEAGSSLRQPLIELGEYCAPALGRAAQLDRFPVRTALRWSARIARWRQSARTSRTRVIAGGIALAAAALFIIPAKLTIEAPAHLAAAVEREVFATASGAVAEVRVSHGQSVAQGDVLLVLSDPDLALKLQQVRGEIAATRERLAALAVTRTDRTLREDPAGDQLPLAAEQRQLDEKLASFERQRELLESRRDALTLRSPRAGQVITRDVQTLLASRPVERGQILLTIADPSSGWELRADVPQRHIGHVLAAKNGSSNAMAVTYRLAGDVQATYPGHVIKISSAAPLDAEGLRDEPAPVEVRIAADGDPPPAARPGMSATVRIDCGRRSLGYVWLHDVAATVYRWITF
jgi:multidrug efflux pump subunit AcrA (membrane-fusion protein)